MRTLSAIACLLIPIAAGCQSESPSTVDPQAVSIDASKLEVVNFSVPDMHCDFSCTPKVREVLGAQPGVAEVDVDLESKTAWVKADGSVFDAEAAVAALVDVQFDATRLITAQEAEQAKAAAEAEADAPTEEETGDTTSTS